LTSQQGSAAAGLCTDASGFGDATQQQQEQEQEYITMVHSAAEGQQQEQQWRQQTQQLLPDQQVVQELLLCQQLLQHLASHNQQLQEYLAAALEDKSQLQVRDTASATAVASSIHIAGRPCCSASMLASESGCSTGLQHS
jgi:hypothetical protein